MKDFNAEEILNMSREELIGLLGNELSVELNEKLANGTITYKEFEEMCKNAFSIPQQATLVRNAILLKLSKSETFNLFETNKEKQEQYTEIANLQEKAENGELNIEELKKLCDIAFGKETELSKQMQIQFIKAGKVKDDKMERNEINIDEYLNKLQVKYGYNEELMGALNKIIPAFIQYFGKENKQLILDAISDCEIHIQGKEEKTEEYISEYFPNKVVEKIPAIAVAFYDSMPIVENGKISSKKLLYLTSRVKGGMQDEKTMSLLVHEMGHLVKSYKDEYSIVDGKIHQRSGIIKNELSEDQETGKFIEKKQTNTGIEEAINCYDEENIMSMILGRPFITKSYFGKFHQSTEKLMQNKEIMEIYRNSQIKGTDEYEKIMGKEEAKEVSDLYENLHLIVTKPILAERMNNGTDIRTLVINAENEILKFVDRYEQKKKDNFSIENIEKLDREVTFDKRIKAKEELKMIIEQAKEKDLDYGGR